MTQKQLNNADQFLLNVHLKDYELTREEMVLRLKEKNSLLRYLILLIGAVIAGLWSNQTGTTNNLILMIIFLIIIPIISTILVFLYNWHDECIIKLKSYLQDEIIPKICKIFGTDDLLTWENFQQKSRQESKLLSYPNLGRLIFIVPILVSVVGYILIENLQNLTYIKWILIFMDIIFIIIILSIFSDINKKFRT